ncbi:MAG: hypothetical protein BWY82_01170 [Verrucomicrobia bacterium ADurb.Bin474]|nr:MAG: hypothetical protein BWY82_01170 [Verrucomicrobia bacterium ADurb.Bin474]
MDPGRNFVHRHLSTNPTRRTDEKTATRTTRQALGQSNLGFGICISLIASASIGVATVGDNTMDRIARPHAPLIQKNRSRLHAISRKGARHSTRHSGVYNADIELTVPFSPDITGNTRCTESLCIGHSIAGLYPLH